MKKILFILAITFSSLSFAQGNLQFNQVLVLDATPAGNLVTVPADKVWKIESVALSNNNAYFQIQWGGLNYFVLNNSSPYANLPFWLPSNESISLVANVNSKVSIIEFNVVP
ncbi:MAG: hypothetical protein P8H56_09350 [Crocinitomicaceae bacterium]|jgi:hypothetical protein|nr:hypothetical protein [Crocinitomicaceae bacterium]MDG1658775.1 hypothetical protein [Crocinitomicaceae bacterium]|tara:strand:- start:8387 stop:8722 length:336 start_codon:yes stop_codon:yes gene_type:complete